MRHLEDAAAPPSPPSAESEPLEFGGNSQGLFITLLVFVFAFGMPFAFYMWKLGKQPPQSISYVISLAWRRVCLPEIDIYLDWFTCISYFAEGLMFEFSFILVNLLMGTLAVSLMAVAYVARNDDYKALPLLTERHGHDLTAQMGWSCFAGLVSGGPIFLGSRVLEAWREITVVPKYRLPQSGPTTRLQVETFVKLVADMKHNVQFQAMYIGGPQLLIQFFFLVKKWDSLRFSLGHWSVVALIKIASPITSALGLIAMQVDFLCENDRFVQRIWRNDAALVMVLVLFDLGAQLIMRVVPLVLLLIHNVWAGSIAIVLGVLWAAIVTLKSGDHDEHDSSHCDHFTEAVLVPFLFFPHAFFFAMAFYPGHEEEDGARRGQPLDCQTAKRALLSRRGTILTIAHISFTLVVGLLALLPAFGDGDDRGGGPANQAFATMGITIAVLLCARLALYYLASRRPQMFDMDVTPVVIAGEGAQVKSEASAVILSVTGEESVHDAPPPPSSVPPWAEPSSQLDDKVAKIRAAKGRQSIAMMRNSNAEPSVCRSSVHRTSVESSCHRPIQPAAAVPEQSALAADAPVRDASNPSSSVALHDVTLGSNAATVASLGASMATGSTATSGSLLDSQASDPRCSVSSVAGAAPSEPSRADGRPLSSECLSLEPSSACSTTNPQPSSQSMGSAGRGSIGSADVEPSGSRIAKWLQPKPPRTSVARTGSVAAASPPSSDEAAASGGWRNSVGMRGSMSVPSAAQAAKEAAIEAWPDMPDYARNLPLRMALEEDSRDDTTTAQAKAAAREAAAKAERAFNQLAHAELTSGRDGEIP